MMGALCILGIAAIALALAFVVLLGIGITGQGAGRVGFADE
jgi:hypothetical protein